MSERPNLLFVTASLGTQWESYSQALIKLGYPTSKRLVLDGKQNWWPLMFLEPAFEVDSDYTIHIDEDCFLFDSKQLDRLIFRMEKQPDVVLAGVPDGGSYYRVHNPYACNLFFLVFKTRALRNLVRDNPGWKNYTFKDEFRNNADLDLTLLDQSRVQYHDFESYYGLFWAVLQNKKRIIYLNSSLDPMLLSTDVHFNGENTPMVRHMWYVRIWNTSELGPYDKIPHRIRFQKLEREIIASFGSDMGFRRALLLQDLRRFSRGVGRGFGQTARWMTTYLYSRKKRVLDALIKAGIPVPAHGFTSHINPLFDAQWYLAQYPDVRVSSLDPYHHFVRHGVFEGRNPNGFFDTSWYLANNSDLRESGMNPLDHYLRHGAAEGRRPSPTSKLPLSVNPFFDAPWYLAQYPDVHESSLDPYDHFVRHGVWEGRNPNAFFDTSWYLANNLDVRASGMNPLDHYLRYGAAEGRKPGPSF